MLKYYSLLYFIINKFYQFLFVFALSFTAQFILNAWAVKQNTRGHAFLKPATFSKNTKMMTNIRLDRAIPKDFDCVRGARCRLLRHSILIVR